MFKRAWADYKEDEELPPLPWNLLPKFTEPVKEPVKKFTNTFSILELEDDSDDEFCIGCESGCDCPSSHTCC